MISSTTRRLVRRLAPLVLFAAGACSDSTDEPKNTLTSAQRTALQNLLADTALASAFLGSSGYTAYASGFLPVIAANLQSIGTITVPSSTGGTVNPAGTYTAFGGQLIVSLKTSATEELHIVWTGVVGVDNLTNPTALFTMGVIDLPATVGPTSVPTTQVGVSGTTTRYVFGTFSQLNGSDPPALFLANTGQIALSNISFTGSEACAGISFNPYVTSCTTGIGTVTGTFNFTGQQLGGEGTVTVPATTVSVPAVRINIAIDISSTQQ